MSNRNNKIVESNLNISEAEELQRAVAKELKIEDPPVSLDDLLNEQEEEQENDDSRGTERTDSC